MRPERLPLRTWLPLAVIRRPSKYFRGDCNIEETPFQTAGAVIVVTTAIKTEPLCCFLYVTRATSQVEHNVHARRLSAGHHKHYPDCMRGKAKMLVVMRVTCLHAWFSGE